MLKVPPVVFFADNVSAIPESMTTTQPLPPSQKQPVVNNKDTSSFKGKCAGMVSEINNCSDKDDGESFQPPQLAGMHSEIESCSEEDDDDSFQPPLKYNIRERLALWATKFNITHIALCALLIILREHNLDIPLDTRTLFATPKATEIQKVADGEYYHFGINNMLHLALKLLRNSLKFSPESIKSLTMRINIDGIPLTNSTKTCLWPILALINEIPEIGVIMIGVYHGTSKPTNLCDYLHDFIGNLKTVVKDGFVFENKVFRVNIPDAFICDAPARSFLKCVKGHRGCYGCERWVQKGEHFRSRIIFPETEASLRNDKQFADNFYQNHQTGTSPFQDLGIGMVSQFVLDYMHLVCLGVV